MLHPKDSSYQQAVVLDGKIYVISSGTNLEVLTQPQITGPRKHPDPPTAPQLSARTNST
jgi:hypothetical protein